MAHDGVIGFVRRLADPTCYAGARDDELIGWFARERDAAAFDVLVRRHVRLVRSAVSRVLASAADIDDAIQATFLVLVERADRANWRAEIGPWLYGVAHRVAVRLRKRNRCRPGPLGDADVVERSSGPDLCWREACAILHAELDRLPDRYRLPLLLCYLEGQTRDEAAAALGESVGTVKGRVRRGCDLLRRRLARRGVSLSVGLLASVTAARSAAGPSNIPSAMLRQPATPRVAQLVQQVNRTMVSTTHKLIAFGLVVVLGLVAVAGFVIADNPQPPHRLVTVAAPLPRRTPPIFLVQDAKGLHFVDATGREKERPEPAVKIGALSPDGRRIAGWEFDKEAGRAKLVIRTRGKPDEATFIPLITGEPGRSGGTVLWARDGRRVAIWENGFTPDGKYQCPCRVYELTTMKLTNVKLPDSGMVSDWSVDGKRFLIGLNSKRTVRLAWLNADGSGKPEFIGPENDFAYGGRLSPDGKRVLYLGGPEPPEGKSPKLRLTVLDLATQKRAVVDEPGATNGYCWSPDGKQIAYTWQGPLPPGGTRHRETFLITCAADGSNRKILTSRQYGIPENSNASPKGQVSFFWVHDWR